MAKASAIEWTEATWNPVTGRELDGGLDNWVDYASVRRACVEPFAMKRTPAGAMGALVVT